MIGCGEHAATTAPTGLWPRARAPFTRLRCALHTVGLLLNPVDDKAVPQGWQQLRSAVVVRDTDGCTTALNEILARTGAHWELAKVSAVWRVTVVGVGEQRPGEAVAAHALAVLVDAGGWGRVTRCASSGCARVIIDTTNGASRTRCDDHTRHHSRRIAVTAEREARRD